MKGRPSKHENSDVLDPNTSNAANGSDPMTNSTALYYHRKWEKEQRFKKIIGQ